MSETDWETRYRTGDMPWEKGEPSPGLVDFLATEPGLDPGTVAIPGCGTGHDVRAWAKAGFCAHGFDIAQSAVELARAKTAEAGLNAAFSQVDFLTAEPPAVFHWLFEHTLFCAIDPRRRDEYVRAAARWLRTGANFLAVFYMISDTDGPPFGVDRNEIMARFSPFFKIVREWVPRSYPNRTGLELMIWWKRV